MEPALRIAVVGAGLIGVRHIEEIQANADCALACVVDPGPKAAAVAAQYGVPLYATLAEGLADKPDGVIIATLLVIVTVAYGVFLTAASAR